MAITNIISFLSIVNFILTLFVFLNAKKSKQHISFLIFSLITTIWLFNNFLIIANVHNFYQLSYGFSILVATSALIWIYNFIEEKLPLFTLFFVVPFSTLMFFIVSFTDFVVGPILKISTFGYESEIGFLFLWHFIYIGILIGVALYKLLQKSLKEKNNLKKSQFIYIFIGAVIFVSLVFLVNFIMPFFWGDSSLVKVTNLAFFPFFALVVYSIFRYQLFGIKIMTTQFLVVLFLSLLLFNFLLSNSLNQYIWNGTILVISVYLGYLIIKSMFKEIEFDKKLLVETKRNLDFEKRLKQTFAEIAEEQTRKIEQIVSKK